MFWPATTVLEVGDAERVKSGEGEDPKFIAYEDIDLERRRGTFKPTITGKSGTLVHKITVTLVVKS